MPLKPIYGKSPLTALEGVALRPGQVRVNDEKLESLYALLCATGKDHIAAWEPAFRLAALLRQKPMEECAAKWIHAAEQAEDGKLADTAADGVKIASAMMAVYEYHPDRVLLEKLMRWCAWLGANWESVIAEQEIRVRAADLMALLCQLYRVTGKKGLIKLMEQLRRESMDWSGVLHTFSVQRPMKRMISRTELDAGMADEGNHEAGFYTRQYLTCHAETLADGARAALESSIYSGNGQEATAAKIGWEKISRWHGAVCGGVHADETLAGQSPAAAIDAAALGAWAEAFAAQLQRGKAAYAAGALANLLHNAMPAAVLGDKLVPFQRANALKMNCGTRDCYTIHEGDEQAMRALTRLSHGWTAAVQSAICATEKGADIHLYMNGVYALQMNGKAVRLTVTGKDGAYDIAISMKEDAAASIRLYTPVWTNDAFIQVNDEGGYEGKKGEYLTLDRTWKNGDVIRIRFARETEILEGYHQSASIRWGENVMVCPVTEEAWAYALAGTPVVRDGKLFVTLKPVAAWKAAHGVPTDLPVLPETAGEAFEAELTPYAETPCRLAVLPRAAKA